MTVSRKPCFPHNSLFGWLVADGWCWFVLREEYCWLVAGGWFVLREKYCWLVADKPSEQGYASCMSCMHMRLCVTLHCSSSLLHVFSSPGKVTNHPFQQFRKNVSPQNVDHFSINVVEYFFEINIGRHFYCVGNVDWVISSWISKVFRTKIWNWDLNFVVSLSSHLSIGIEPPC
jgi:hypothetical protein